MLALVSAVLIVISISAMCSLFEAVLYSMPVSHIETLVQSKNRAGRILQRLRENIDEPITAILSLNTISNTAGAAVAGALAQEVLHTHGRVYVFSAAFTVAILLFSEILPKTIGVVYSRMLASMIAYPLRAMVILFRPLIVAISMVTRFITGEKGQIVISPEELIVMARLGVRSGSIDADEGRVIQNMLSLGSKRVRDVMTPRPVVFALHGDVTLGEVYQIRDTFPYSRVPVYMNDMDDVIGVAYRREMVEAGSQLEQAAKPVSSLLRSIHFVPESLELDKVLDRFLSRSQHMFAVVDEYGGFAGVITLEDVMEAILGREIVDEFDQVADMQALARQRRQEVMGPGNATGKDEGPS